MKHTALLLVALLVAINPLRAVPEDRAKNFLIGMYLGDEMQSDGPSGSAMHRTFYVRTDSGTWSLVTASDTVDAVARSVGIAQLPFRAPHPILFDNLKHGEKFAFRAEPDHRIGSSGTSYHVYVPRVDDPKKEDKYDAEFKPIAPPEPTSANNVKAMCDAHRFSGEQEKQYCGNE